MVQLATLQIPLVTLHDLWLLTIMYCYWGHIISFLGDIINLWGHIISFWGHIISFWGRYPYWGQGSIGGKIIILWGDFELGARLLTYGGILLTFGGVIINYIWLTASQKEKVDCIKYSSMVHNKLLLLDNWDLEKRKEGTNRGESKYSLIWEGVGGFEKTWLPKSGWQKAE